jgi:recombination protein RecR
MNLPKELLNLTNLIAKLPDIGPKLSTRIGIYLVLNRKDVATNLVKAIEEALSSVKECENCNNIATDRLCNICASNERDKSLVLIVEDIMDLQNIETSQEYVGTYHVLGGVISPMNGVGPDNLNIQDLLKRVMNDDIKEIIIALNPNIEGESTSMYLKDRLTQLKPDVKVSRLAIGIPAGSDIEYVSGKTIGESIRQRTLF